MPAHRAPTLLGDVFTGVPPAPACCARQAQRHPAQECVTASERAACILQRTHEHCQLYLVPVHSTLEFAAANVPHLLHSAF